MCSLSSLACAQTASTGAAQDWPSRPIRFIARFPPGGGTDLNARMIVPRIATALGQQVVVENRPGAGGMLGTEIIAKSAPDGYSMVIAAIGPIAINPSLYSKMPYDPAKDLAPVTITGEVPNGLVVHPTLPATSVRELIALAKQRPIIDCLISEVVKALGAPDVKQKLLEMGLLADTNTPEQFAAFIQSESVNWAKAVKGAGIKLD
jgi:tripartite-type tricarboxylate transporter receptor subunit TctC